MCLVLFVVMIKTKILSMIPSILLLVVHFMLFVVPQNRPNRVAEMVGHVWYILHLHL